MLYVRNTLHIKLHRKRPPTECREKWHSSHQRLEMKSISYRSSTPFLFGWQTAHIFLSALKSGMFCYTFECVFCGKKFEENAHRFHLEQAKTQLSLFPSFGPRKGLDITKKCIFESEKACLFVKHTLTYKRIKKIHINTKQTRSSTTQFASVHYLCDKLYAEDTKAAAASTTKRIHFVYASYISFFLTFWTNNVQCGETHSEAFVSWLLLLKRRTIYWW